MKLPTLEKARFGDTPKVAARSIASFLGLIFIIVFFQITTGGRLLSARNLQTFSNYAFATIIPCCGGIFLSLHCHVGYLFYVRRSGLCVVGRWFAHCKL